MELKCNWRGNKVLNVECRGDQMVVNHGGKVGDIHICEEHVKALQSISPMSGAKFTKINQPTEERE